MTKQELISRVNSDPALLKEFQNGWGRPSIEEYLAEYSYVEDIVNCLANDLGVE